MSGFVGRVEELAGVRGLLDGVSRGGRGALLVVGEPGSGKTRLVVEAIRSARLEVFQIAGYRMEQTVPLASARTMLRRLVELAETGKALEDLVFGGKAEGVDPLRVFESIHQCLQELSKAALIMDDLQWADERTVALLHYLLRAALAEGAPLGLVVTSRPGSAAAGMDEALQKLLGSEFRRLDLGPLDRTDGLELVRSLLPGVSESSAEHLWEQAGGLPFWLEMLATEGEGEVERLLEVRLQTVGPDAVSLLGVLAVAGHPMLLAELTDLTGWTPGRLEETVWELANRGVVLSNRETAVVAHDLLRDAILRQLPSRRARELRGSMASWLEQQAGDDVFALGEALVHRRAAGDQGVELALRLATGPHRRLLGLDALGNLAEIAAEAGKSGLRLRRQIAELADESGEFAVSLEQWTELATAAEDNDRRARATLRAAEAALWLHRYQECRGLLAQARHLSGGHVWLGVELDALEARLLRWVDNLPEEASVLTERALRASSLSEGDQEEKRRARFAALKSAYDRALVNGDLGSMLEATEELATVADSEEASLMASLQAANCFGRLGRWEEAQTRLRSIWDQAGRRVLPRLAVAVGPWLAHALLVVGRVGEAVEVARQVLVRSERLGGVADAAVARRTLHLADLMKGEVRQSLRDLEADIGQTDMHYRIGHRQALAWWWARLEGEGAAQRVSEHVEAGRADVEEVGCPRCRGEFMLHAAEALARIGDIAEARLILSDLGTDIDNADLTSAFWKRRADAAAAESWEAVSRWTGVGEEAGRLGMHLDALWANLDLAVALERFDEERAIEQLVAVGVRAGELGIVTVERLAERELRARGIRSRRRGVRGSGDEPFDRLTEREREIARLLATGASNPEIASTVFVSRKTVERHVSNILAKLGVRNRAEVAALMGGKK